MARRIVFKTRSRSVAGSRGTRLALWIVCSIVALTVLWLDAFKESFLAVRSYASQVSSDKAPSVQHSRNLAARAVTRSRSGALCDAAQMTAALSMDSYHGTRTLRYCFGGESEVDRLRRENAELKKKLGGSEENFLQKIVRGAKSLIGLGPQEATSTSAPAPLAPLNLPGAAMGLASGLAGALAQPIIGMIAGAFKGSQEDIQAVLTAAQTVLVRSGRLGTRVECGPILSQAYSSMNINGQQTTSVQLQFQANGNSGRGMVACAASIGSTGVEFKDFRLDGSPLDTSLRDTSNVIDV